MPPRWLARTWSEYEELYGETQAEHRCPICGGWLIHCPHTEQEIDEYVKERA